MALLVGWIWFVFRWFSVKFGYFLFSFISPFFASAWSSHIKILDARAVADISAEVEKLYDSKELRAKSVEEWI